MSDLIHGPFACALAAAPLKLPTAGIVLRLRADRGLYQDAAGTTPVASNADPVGRWNSMVGALYGTQPGSSLKRPTYRTAQVNGRPAVRFDGTDDALQVASLGLGSFSMFAVWKPTYPNNGDNNPRFPIEHSATPNTNPGLNLVFSNDLTALHTVARGASGVNKSGYRTTAANAKDFGTGSWSVAAVQYDGTHAGHAAYRNGFTNPISTTTVSTYNANPGTGTVTDTLNIGSRNNASFFAQMDLAELVVYSPALSATRFKQAVRYLSRVYGITLT